MVSDFKIQGYGLATGSRRAEHNPGASILLPEKKATVMHSPKRRRRRHHVHAAGAVCKVVMADDHRMGYLI